MPCTECANGRWRWGSGPCEYGSSEECQRAHPEGHRGATPEEKDHADPLEPLPRPLRGFRTTDHQSVNEGRLHLASIVPEPKMECWVMGGAVRDVLSGSPVRNDVDLFFPDDKSCRFMMDQIVTAGGMVVSEKSNKTKYRMPGGVLLDVIHQAWGTIENLVTASDFAVASGCFDLKSKTFLGQADFFPDLSAKVLTIGATPNPLGTLNRIGRYAMLGFRLPYGEAMRLGKRIREAPSESEAKMFNWKEEECR